MIINKDLLVIEKENILWEGTLGTSVKGKYSNV